MVKERRMMEEALADGVHHDFINNLSDNCFIHIFSFLSVEDRLRSTAVCKRWRGFGFDAWQDIMRLDLIFLKKLESQHPRLIKLCGKVLKDLTIFVPNNTSNIIQTVTTNCSNLMKFRVRFEDNGDRAKHWKDLAELFAKNRATLRNVVLDNMNKKFHRHVDCLSELPDELVELQLWGYKASPRYDAGLSLILCMPFIPVNTLIGRMKNLEILVLNGFPIVQSTLRVIESLKNLRCLEIYGRYECFLEMASDSDGETEYHEVSKMVTIPDSFMDNLVRNNPTLRHLKLKNSLMTEIDQGKIFQLSELETLSLRFPCYDENLYPNALQNLRKLSLQDAKNEEIVLLIKRAPKLEFILLLYPEGGLNVLDMAHEAVSHRVDNVPLHIVVPNFFIRNWVKPERIYPLFRVESLKDYWTRTEEYHGYDLELSSS